MEFDMRQKKHIMKRPWLYQRDILANISIGRLYLKACEYWQSPAFFLYHITSPCIDPVKQLELFDLISQTDAVTLCWQIKIQINLPSVKRKKSREREQEREREGGREWETLNKRCHLPRWNFNEVNS